MTAFGATALTPADSRGLQAWRPCANWWRNEFAALKARNMGYDRQTSAEGPQNPRLDVGPFPAQGSSSGAVKWDFVTIVAQICPASGRAMGFDSAREMRR